MTEMKQMKREGRKIRMEKENTFQRTITRNESILMKIYITLTIGQKTEHSSSESEWSIGLSHDMECDPLRMLLNVSRHQFPHLLNGLFIHSQLIDLLYARHCSRHFKLIRV